MFPMFYDFFQAMNGRVPAAKMFLPTAALLLHGIGQAGAQLQDHLGIHQLGTPGSPTRFCLERPRESLLNPYFADPCAGQTRENRGK